MKNGMPQQICMQAALHERTSAAHPAKLHAFRGSFLLGMRVDNFKAAYRNTKRAGNTGQLLFGAYEDGKNDPCFRGLNGSGKRNIAQRPAHCNRKHVPAATGDSQRIKEPRPGGFLRFISDEYLWHTVSLFPSS